MEISDELRAILTQRFHECNETSLKNLTKTIIDQEKEYITAAAQSSSDEKFCERTFDGFSCWNRTPAGQTVYQTCPGFITGFDIKLQAHKTCLENGTWFAHPDTGKPWSNYTTCIDHPDLEFRTFINSLYVHGYAISLVTLVISLSVFFSFKSLKCTRIKIHIQLFISLALSCIHWILWYKFVVVVPERLEENSSWCISFHLLIQYFMLANYFWMFCEGLHLHLVLVVVFVKDAVALRWFFLIGWISPLFWLSLYAAVRSQNDIDSLKCWSDESHSVWILTVPVIISLAVSTLFLINVVRVLLTKLHPCSTQPVPLALQKAARATLILVPLFGLQNILLPFRPNPGTELERIYQFVSAVLISSQGFVVSCLFCFANHDVVAAVRNFFGRYIPSCIERSSYESNMHQQATQSRDVVV